MLGLESEINNSDLAVAAVVSVVWLWVVAYAQVAVVNQVVAAANLAVALAVYAWAAAWGWDSNSVSNKFLEDNPFLKIYGLKSNQQNTYVVANLYVEQFINDLADGLEKDVPSAYSKVSKDEFKQLMKLNIGLSQ